MGYSISLVSSYGPPSSARLSESNEGRIALIRTQLHALSTLFRELQSANRDTTSIHFRIFTLLNQLDELEQA